MKPVDLFQEQPNNLGFHVPGRIRTALKLLELVPEVSSLCLEVNIVVCRESGISWMPALYSSYGMDSAREYYTANRASRPRIRLFIISTRIFFNFRTIFLSACKAKYTAIYFTV